MNTMNYDSHAEWCDLEWGQSNLRHKFVNGICYVETEDGFIPDWRYKGTRK